MEVPADAIDGEGALTEALLRSVEAYERGHSAQRRPWALVHAREARDLYGALDDQLVATSAALAELKTLYGTDAEAGAALRLRLP